jgi:hypothetical protein
MPVLSGLSASSLKHSPAGLGDGRVAKMQPQARAGRPIGAATIGGKTRRYARLDRAAEHPVRACAQRASFKIESICCGRGYGREKCGNAQHPGAALE